MFPQCGKNKANNKWCMTSPHLTSIRVRHYDNVNLGSIMLSPTQITLRFISYYSSTDHPRHFEQSYWLKIIYFVLQNTSIQYFLTASERDFVYEFTLSEQLCKLLFFLHFTLSWEMSLQSNQMKIFHWKNCSLLSKFELHF